jgi:hypothetical protein
MIVGDFGGDESGKFGRVEVFRRYEDGVESLRQKVSSVGSGRVSIATEVHDRECSWCIPTAAESHGV